jgi:AcrR family transcriptional regulator
VAEPERRRDRVRASTIREIKETARAVLVADGPEGLTLRAIAREMGMSAPALYRYFPSREELLEGLVADLYGEVTAVMEAARDAEDEGDVPARLVAVCRAFRGWAVAHRPEFGLLFGSPIAGVRHAHPHPHEPGGDDEHPSHRFGNVFGALVAQAYLTRPFPIPADDEIDPRLRTQLHAWCRTFPMPLPDGVTQVFISCWIRLYGIVSMEAFGHLEFALDDVEPMFEAELRSLGETLGMADAYAPPPARA